MAVVVQIWTVEHIFGQRMRFWIRDKATDIRHKSVVLDMSVHGDHILKTLLLNASKTQERYMLACVPSFSVAEEWSSSGPRCRVILSIVLPVEQISDGLMLAVIVEVPLVVTQELWFVCTEITARYHP